ncbi:MAG TPA: hypothetical protein VL307_11425 [Chitinophagaceae bacterium]|nr:hypothetical protein [Chitinophagaceae bacterium]
MKNHFIGLLVFIVCSSCHQSAIVEKSFTDSLLAHYTSPAAISATEKDIQFWKGRIDPQNTGLSNESRYASSLVARFQQLGNIHDLKAADSIMQRVNTVYNAKETGPQLALCHYSLLQHSFLQADAFLETARKLGLKRYELLSNSFDVDFELGRYSNAGLYVQQMKPYADYGYFFRRSKMDHLNGRMDSAINSMLSAAKNASSSAHLQNVALANAADLYIHAGRLQEAYDLYKLCVRGNAADYHSIIGMGWIALVHDNNDSLAQQLFSFVQTKYLLPDPLFKLYQAAQHRKDSIETARYATAFAQQASDSLYGNMYNKYLIELYTGVLSQPSKAVTICKRELENRSTPQTNAWYAWSLFCNQQPAEAYALYQQSVSGKPLEGLELYWMGKMMQGLGKGYNARAFFKEAYKNKYDLSPAMTADLEKLIKD